VIHVSKPSIFIADSSYSFTRQLSEAIILDGSFNICGTAITGIETLDMIQQLHPDILVLDLLITIKDGIDVLKSLCSEPNPPVVITTSAFVSDYQKEMALKYGACCVIKKPCTLESVIESIKQNIHNNCLSDPMLNSITLDRDLTALLQKLEIQPVSKGYQYLKDAIEIAIFHPLAVTEIKKEIYIPLGKKYGLTADHISMEIKKAICHSIKKRNKTDCYDLLGICATAKSITAAELIATVANKLLYRI